MHGCTGDEEGAAAVLSSSEELELLPLGEVVAVLQRSTHRCVCCKCVYVNVCMCMYVVHVSVKMCVCVHVANVNA